MGKGPRAEASGCRHRPQQPGGALHGAWGRYADPEPLYKLLQAIQEKANGLVLVSARGTFRSGSTISKADEYRIHLRTEGADKVWLIYHEKNDAPVTLVSRKSIGSGRGIKYPDDVQKGVKIDTKAAFVTFGGRMQHQGRVSRKY